LQEAENENILHL